MATSLTDLMAAHRAYAEARLKAIEDASNKDADPAVTARQHQQALLKYLQTRAKLLTDARARVVEQFDTEIAQYQQRVGELQQIIEESSSPAPPTPAPEPAPAPTTDAAAKRKRSLRPSK